MYRKIFIFLMLFLAAILEVSFFPNLILRGAVPDFLLVIFIIFSARKKFEYLWAWAAVAGFILDIMSFSPPGLHAASFLIVAFGIGFLSNRFFINPRQEAFLMIALFVIGGALVNYMAVNFIFSAAAYFSFSESANFFRLFDFKNIFSKLSYDLIIFALFYIPITKFENVFRIDRGKLAVR